MTPELAVSVIRNAFRADGEGRTHVPPVINLDVPSAPGEFHIKTAYIEGVPQIAVKIAFGSDSPGEQELEAACLARADRLVVDRLSQCAAFGELAPAVKARLVAPSAAVELGVIVSGDADGRTSDGQITIADLTGVGFQDTAIASAAFRRLAAQ